MIKIYRTENYDAMSFKAASILGSQVLLKPDSVLGLATGSTPVGMYKQLAQWCKEGELDFSKVSSINLDEYKGLEPENDQSYRYFMNVNFFSHINIDKEKTNVPNGLEMDSKKECARYEKLISDFGGIDMQVLGLGHNGHIAFNEPADEFIMETHVVGLTQSTIDANMRFFEKREDVPKEAYTMGIRGIMQARKILLMVSGEEKAEIIKQVFCGPVTPKVPASILQMHSDVYLVGDIAALSLI